MLTAFFLHRYHFNFLKKYDYKYQKAMRATRRRSGRSPCQRGGSQPMGNSGQLDQWQEPWQTRSGNDSGERLALIGGVYNPLSGRGEYLFRVQGVIIVTSYQTHW